MTTEQRCAHPLWFYSVLAIAAIAIAAALVYRLVCYTERDWIQLDDQGTGKWSENKLLLPRLFDRRTGEFCEYRGLNAKTEYTSQYSRGPWICYPGPVNGPSRSD